MGTGDGSNRDGKCLLERRIFGLEKGEEGERGKGKRAA